MRKVVLIILSLLVALLMIVPPIFAWLVSVTCMNPTGGACRTVTLQDWLTGDLATIWQPPFVLALVLIGVIFLVNRKSS